MRIPGWLYWLLIHIPGVKVTESGPMRLEELTNLADRVIREYETQWHYNHPNEEFPGIEESELMREVERRAFNV